ncbi:MAG: hydrophobic protein [Candidatus Dormibacteraceae bacterium]
MIAALIVLLVILVVFGAGGFALHLLWYGLIIAAVLWLLGFFFAGSTGGRWYRR